LGIVPRGQALLPSAAGPGDDLYASGTLGDARVALEVFRGALSLPAPVFEAARARMEAPAPRLALALALRGIPTAAIDVSDGLAGDLRHVLRLSGVGATLEEEALVTLLACGAHVERERRLSFVVSGGDDYELLFTAPPSARAAVEHAAAASQTPVTRIGRIEAAPGMRLVDAHGRRNERAFESFDHFA
jgi:thiamine-monophosphate kinase